MAGIPQVNLTELHLVKENGQEWYALKWEGPDWEEALRRIKSWIEPSARRFDTQTNYWYVRKHAAEQMLPGVFADFTQMKPG